MLWRTERVCGSICGFFSKILLASNNWCMLYYSKAQNCCFKMNLKNTEEK